MCIHLAERLLRLRVRLQPPQLQPATPTHGNSKILLSGREQEREVLRQDNGRRNEESFTKINIMKKQVDKQGDWERPPGSMGATKSHSCFGYTVTPECQKVTHCLNAHLKMETGRSVVQHYPLLIVSSRPA